MNEEPTEAPSDVWRTLEEGAILRRAREDLGLTQRELAQRIQRESQWISQCERGVSDLSAVDVGKLKQLHPEAYRELTRRRLAQIERELQIDDVQRDAANELALDLSLVRAQVKSAHGALAQALTVLSQIRDA